MEYGFWPPSQQEDRLHERPTRSPPSAELRSKEQPRLDSRRDRRSAHGTRIRWLASRAASRACSDLKEHLDDNGELLPHLLFGDVTRYAADLARRAETEPDADVALIRLLEDLDGAILPEGEDDDPVDNVLWVSFVEDASTDEDEPLRSRLREFPNLARALSHYE